MEQLPKEIYWEKGMLKTILEDRDSIILTRSDEEPELLSESPKTVLYLRDKGLII